jgi:hypothetical protein
MFLIPGIIALFIFALLRPHEIFEPLNGLNSVTLLGAAALGWVLDTRIRVSRPRGSALLLIAFVFTGWAIVTVTVKAPSSMGEQLSVFGASILMFLIIAEGVRSFRGVNVIAGVLLAITLVLAGLGVEQGLSSSICYLRGEDASAAAEGATIDGRPCTTRRDCEEGAPAGSEFLCEHPGLLGTHSIAGRVRFRGILEDPNELAWTISMGVPLAFAFRERRRTEGRLALLVVTVMLAGMCVIMTKSRSGQLALAAVLAVYFLRRFGKRGVFAAVPVVVTLLLLGGRSGQEADESSMERLESWAEGLQMWRENPVLGVGFGQFSEHHYLTAHNSFMLTLAEMGPLGLLLWTGCIYLAAKILIRMQIDLRDRPEAIDARSWSTALLASLVGMVISAAFLSLAYHTALWIYLGLVGALYAAVRQHEPGWRVGFGWRDLMLLGGIDVAIVSGFALYIRWKGV